MKLNEEIRRQWKYQYEHGDIRRIYLRSIRLHSEDPEIKPVSRQTVGQAINTGHMNENTFEHINGYYTEKKQQPERLNLEQGD